MNLQQPVLWGGLIGISAAIGLLGLGHPPTLAQPTAVTANPLAGWKAFQGNGIELWLPDTFRGGSPTAADAAILIQAIKTLGPEYAQIARLVEQNPRAFVLFAVDPTPNQAGGVTNVLVAAEKIPSLVTLEMYLSSMAQLLPAQIQILDRTIVSMKSYQAGRLVTQAQAPNITVKQLIYVIKQGDRIWTIGYSTGADEYTQRLPVFEQSIATFKTQAGQAIGLMAR